MFDGLFTRVSNKESSEENMLSIRSKLTNSIYLLLLVFSAPTLVLQVYLSLSRGEYLPPFIYSFIYLLWLFGYIFRQRIGIKLRVLFLIVPVYIVGFYAVLTTGLSGGGYLFLITAVMMTTLFLGGRWGFVGIAISLAGHVIAGVMINTGVISIDADKLMNSLDIMPWAVAFFVFLIVSGSMVIVTGQMLSRLSILLSESRERERLLERKNVELEETVEKLKRTKKALSKQKRRKEMYLDIISHDISNLHQGLMLSAEIMKEKVKDSSMEPNLSRIINLTRRSINLGKYVSLLSNIDRMDVKPCLVNLDREIERIYQAIRDEFPDPDMRFEIELASKNSFIRADRYFELIPLNIIRNAVEAHHQRRVNVKVETGRSGSRAFLKVTDHGVGIPDSHKKRIMKRFSGDLDRTLTGIGLSMVRKLVLRYKGEIRIEDRVGGDSSKGTIFTVLFPVHTDERVRKKTE